MKNANELFEELAEQFYKETGYMAPGKDAGYSESRSYEERMNKWGEWNKKRISKEQGKE